MLLVLHTASDLRLDSCHSKTSTVGNRRPK